MTASKPNFSKSVFISYRRDDDAHAAMVFDELETHNYAVFMDVQSIGSGEFEEIIFRQIKAHVHFVVVLTPGVLKSTADRRDWLRREIEYALKVERNIVPLMVHGFTFKQAQADFADGKLPGELNRLAGFNGVDLPNAHKDHRKVAFRRLRKEFLQKPAKGLVVPTSKADRPEVQRRTALAQAVVQAATKDSRVGRGHRYRQLLGLNALIKLTAVESPSTCGPFRQFDFRWTKVPGEHLYVLEQSSVLAGGPNTGTFWTECYRGTCTSHREMLIGSRVAFRVRVVNARNVKTVSSNVITLTASGPWFK